MLKNSLYVGVAVLAAFLIRVASVQLNANKPVEEEDVEVRISPKQKSKRKPASVSVPKPKLMPQRERPSRPQRMVQDFEPRAEEPVMEEKFGIGGQEEIAGGPMQVGSYSADATYVPPSGSRGSRSVASGSRVGSVSNAPKTSASTSGTASGGSISGGVGGPVFGNVGFTTGSTSSGTTTGDGSSTTGGTTTGGTTTGGGSSTTGGSSSTGGTTTGGTTTGGTTTGGSSTGGTTTGGTTTGGTTTGGTSTGGTTGGVTSLSCNAVSGSGAYSSAVTVTISCDAPADISYCVSAGDCSVQCDPNSGTAYSSPLLIGTPDGTYCLSYVGSTATGVDSPQGYAEYTVDSSLPDLSVTYGQTYYQTTELEGLDSIASNDFGQGMFGIGQINTKDYDPATDGRSCEHIVENYVTYPATTSPLSILDLFDVSGLSNSQQVDVPLVLADLQYGENFITTFIKNANVTPASYSCSTQKVVLEDFDYFQADSSHGYPGTNTVREFAGGFTAYGFFEPEIAAGTSRQPAGESFEDASGEKLETGIFSIFY